jgi:hypothetical protein
MELTMKPVIMHQRTWNKILDLLHNEYPPSYFLRHKMRAKLGFTSREHQAWYPNDNYSQEYAAYERERAMPNELTMLLSMPPERGRTRTEIHLDFYSENKRTMFLLKYSEELAKDDKRY